MCGALLKKEQFKIGHKTMIGASLNPMYLSPAPARFKSPQSNLTKNHDSCHVGTVTSRGRSSASLRFPHSAPRKLGAQPIDHAV